MAKKGKPAPVKAKPVKPVKAPPAKPVKAPPAKPVKAPPAKPVKAKPVKPVKVKPVKPVKVKPVKAKPVKVKPIGKKKKKECPSDEVLKTKTTEITNLKYQIDTLDKENKGYVYQIDDMNKQVIALNKQVRACDTRIHGPLVEAFSSAIIEGLPENPEPVKRSDPYKNYNIKQSGLLHVSNEYKRLYGNYYAGYQENETMIEDVLKPQVDYLSKTDLDGMQYSYVAVQQQNKTLETQIEDTAEEYSTDFQRAKYVENEITSVKRRNAIFFFGFYILFMIFAYALLFEGGNEFSLQAKLGILVFVFVYPYLVGYVSRIAIFIYRYAVAVFRGVPYMFD